MLIHTYKLINNIMTLQMKHKEKSKQETIYKYKFKK